MGSLYRLAKMVLCYVVLLGFLGECLGGRTLTALYEPPPMSVSYHNGVLLEGNLPVSILWYGDFSVPQKSAVADFILSLNPQNPEMIIGGPSPVPPTVAQWWSVVRTYMKIAGKKETQIILTNQHSDKNCSMGKSLKRSQILELARRITKKHPGGLALVLTSQDVAVEGFCMSNCGFHGSDPSLSSVYIWVGNSATQCPGQCAWPFHQPIYGPQSEPLSAPNGDVGVDGMIINIATLLAETATNPYGNGYFLGPPEAPQEVASLCSGIFGSGAYPGYTGELLKDGSTGASYNAVGVRDRKYLLPALFDPSTSSCSTLV